MDSIQPYKLADRTRGKVTRVIDAISVSDNFLLFGTILGIFFVSLAVSTWFSAGRDICTVFALCMKGM